ncbi:hypothetical protein BDN70DRAFT_935134 [Pholiota conissans]|uniref:M-phase inducer phosphatase n=1 Tax=Pholiota conissans TaxID=109636 RepID=A0A9P6CQW3_9AGAR|nr:hypothetical protein BDN70DRAFT_935134 [Pholiota conissans]
MSMPFLDHLIERTAYERRLKKRKHFHSAGSSDEMSFFGVQSNNFLAPSFPSRKKSQRFRNDVEEFLPDDLEVSFASNVSLNSPPHEHISLATSDLEPMDISPAPVKSKQRPRAYTSGGSRLFGSDLSNTRNLSPADAITKPATGTQSNAKKIQRSALPTEWFSAARAPEPPSPGLMREPSSPMDDAMDVDTSYVANAVDETNAFAPTASSAAPTITTFNHLFYGTTSPPSSSRRSFESPAASDNKKRRSLSPESIRSPGQGQDSSPMLPSSPSDAKMHRMGKPGLQGLGAPSASFLKRPRRPVLSAMVQPYDHAHSAYPTLSPGQNDGSNSDDPSPRGAPPVRRAFSAFLPPSIYTEQDDEDTSFDGPDMSSPAQAYSKRQQVKTIRRCDGTEDFRPLTGATALALKESPSAKFMAAGLPGFGDNEAHGKILPCHRVTEDGLMRITSHTLDALLDGAYNEFITDFHVIDCRFDYEYNGGHVPGAVNINTTTAVEELLLGPSLTKPKPSVSGDSARKTILIFHCEFSAKRAPTFAKHLRAKDRAMNNHMYPKIHYPEVYILEGGYCQYFKTSGSRCDPPAYVTMDDPNHAHSRREDLDQFRKAKFGRHKSYAYGDGSSKGLSFGQGAPVQQASKRNTAPSAPQSLFAAATAARSRRGGNGLTTLAEDGNVTADADDTDTDIGDSPCPPPTKATTFKGKKLVRNSIARAETYGPARMPY